MKKLFLIALISLLTISALTGCGVPAEDYDKVVGDLTAAQTQIQKLEADLASTQTKISQLEDENATLQNDLETTKTEYATLQTENDDLNVTIEEVTSRLESAYVYEQILVELLLPAVTGDELTAPFKISNVQAFVDKNDDQTLKVKFEAWSNSPSNRTLVGEFLAHALLSLENILYY